MQNAPHRCLVCGNFLMARVAKSGNYPGIPYIHCPPPCNTHRTFFPAGFTAPAAQSQAVSAPPLGNRTPRTRCIVCSKNANMNCRNRMCKNDCIIKKGGCHLSDHKPNRLNQRQPVEEKAELPKQSPEPEKKLVGRAALAACFTVVFWKHHLADPIILAIHDCPSWPKWVLEDAADLYDDFGFDLNAAPSSRRVQFYNLEASRWISCASGFPHSVTKDGYLLLRARDLDSDEDCIDFNAFRKLARSSHDDAPKVHGGHINVVSPGDIVMAKASIEARRKRQREDVELGSPVCKRRFSSPPSAPFSPPWRLSVTPKSRARSRSPSITVSSPRRILVSRRRSLSSSPSIETTSPRPIL